MKQSISFFFLFLLLFMTTGCLHFKQEITIKPDKTAVVEMTWRVPVKNLQTMYAVQRHAESVQGIPKASGARSMNWIFNEKLAEDYYSHENVKMKSYKLTTEGEDKVVHIVCEAKNYKKALTSGLFGEFVVRNGWKETSMQAIYSPSISKLSDKDLDAMQTLLKGLKVEFIVNAPDKLLDSTADKQFRSRAVWTFDIDKNPKKLDMLPEIKLAWKD